MGCQESALIQPSQTQDVSKVSGEEAWKQDPRIQALIVDRMQQIEADAKKETIQGKKKRYGIHHRQFKFCFIQAMGQ